MDRHHPGLRPRRHRAGPGRRHAGIQVRAAAKRRHLQGTRRLRQHPGARPRAEIPRRDRHLRRQPRHRRRLRRPEARRPGQGGDAGQRQPGPPRPGPVLRRRGAAGPRWRHRLRHGRRHPGQRGQILRPPVQRPAHHPRHRHARRRMGRAIGPVSRGPGRPGAANRRRRAGSRRGHRLQAGNARPGDLRRRTRRRQRHGPELRHRRPDQDGRHGLDRRQPVRPAHRGLQLRPVPPRHRRPRHHRRRRPARRHGGAVHGTETGSRAGLCGSHGGGLRTLAIAPGRPARRRPAVRQQHDLATFNRHMAA